MTTYLKYKPAWLQLLIFAGLVMGIFTAGSLVGILIISKLYGLSLADLSGNNLSNTHFVSALKAMQVLSSLALFLIPSLVFAFLSDRQPMRYIGFKKPVPVLFYAIAVGVILASFPMVSWLSELNQHLHLPKSMQSLERLIRSTEEQNNNLIKSFLDMRSPQDLIVMLFIIAVLPAIGEELFFRGVIQRLFIQITKRPWTGIIVTAIIFSAAHLQFLGFFPRVVLGIVLGALYWYSGSLWPGIIAHFINNALQVILIYTSPQLIEKEPDFPAKLTVLSTLAVVALTWWMHRISQTTYAEMYDTDDFHIGRRDEYVA